LLGEPGVDYPEDKTVVDVIASSRTDALMSWVEEVRADELVVTVPRDRSQRPVNLETGERVEMVWKGPEDLRALPVELVAVEKGQEPSWRLRPVGPAGRGQRRAAVRTPIVLSVQIVKGELALSGVTTDLSEGGLRCLLEQPEQPSGDSAGQAGPADPAKTADAVKAAAPAGFGSGDVVEVSASLDGTALTCQAEVVRRHHRNDARTELSLRFIGLSEFLQDVIRRHVFATLRDLRLRGLV
jgi:hypothetical protein